jgi:hypothetical protein
MLDELFGRFGPVVVDADARRLGLPVKLLCRAADHGLVLRLSKCGFVMASRYEAADPWEQFRLRSIAFGMTLAEDTYLTEAAAQVIHQLPVLHEPPVAPIAIRNGSAHRGPDRTPVGRVRTGYLPPRFQVVRDRVRTVSVSYTAIDVARHTDPAEALAVVDQVLRRGVDRAELAYIIEHMEHYPGMDVAAWAVTHGDGRAETALESLGRLAFIEVDRKPPLSNVWIDDGRRAVRVDHLIEDSGVVLEGDGAVKLNNRPDAAKVIENQVERERFLRRLDYSVERYNFVTARSRRSEILRRADRAARERGGRRPPTSWSMEPPVRLANWSALQPPVA